VIAVTASAFGEVARPHARRLHRLCAKPIRAEVLFSKLRQHLGVSFVSPRRTSLTGRSPARCQAHAAKRRRLSGSPNDYTLPRHSVTSAS
jgi:hypothetical protein